VTSCFPYEKLGPCDISLRVIRAVLLSSRPGLGLGLEDPRGHHLEVLALALVLVDQVLILAFFGHSP